MHRMGMKTLIQHPVVGSDPWSVIEVMWFGIVIHIEVKMSLAGQTNGEALHEKSDGDRTGRDSGTLSWRTDR